jgi:hypothetical protein
MPTTEYRGQTAAETVLMIAQGGDPWLAVGQFLDDWRRTPAADREGLVLSPPPGVGGDALRWVALLAASVDWLCYQDGIDAPPWTADLVYRLREPWFLYPGWRLRAWQLVDTPAPFKARNVFGGDRILDRV